MRNICGLQHRAAKKCATVKGNVNRCRSSNNINPMVFSRVLIIHASHAECHDPISHPTRIRIIYTDAFPDSFTRHYTYSVFINMMSVIGRFTSVNRTDNIVGNNNTTLNSCCSTNEIVRIFYTPRTAQHE